MIKAKSKRSKVFIYLSIAILSGILSGSFNLETQASIGNNSINQGTYTNLASCPPPCYQNFSSSNSTPSKTDNYPMIVKPTQCDPCKTSVEKCNNESCNKCPNNDCEKKGCDPCKKGCDVKKVCPDLSKCWEERRQEIYKLLCLNEDQLCKAQRLDCKYKKIFDDLFKELKCKEDKLCSLIDNCACKDEKKDLKEDIKDLKKEIEWQKEEHDSEFMCFLNKCQKKQYKEIIKTCKKSEKERQKANCNCGS